MPWISTTNCEAVLPAGSYCLCPDFPGNILTPGSPGETKSAPCNPCGPFGVKVEPTICCNLSGSISE